MALSSGKTPNGRKMPGVVAAVDAQEVQLWEKQHGEIDTEWQAFKFYRDNRPITVGMVAEELNHPLNTVLGWSADYCWTARTTAYDRFLDLAGTNAARAQEEARRRRQARLAGDLQETVFKALARKARELEMDANPKLGEIAKATEIAIKLERLIYGESTERAEVVAHWDLSKLSDEELQKVDEISKKAAGQ